MASSTDSGGDDTTTGRRLPLLAVAGLVLIAVVGFAGAYMMAGGDDDAPAGEGLAAESSQDDADAGDASSQEAEEPDYDIVVEPDPDPPAVEGTEFTVTVTEGGEPVTGAAVRIKMEMSQHAHEGVNADGEETGESGVYRVPVKFVMRGGWAGHVQVDAPGEPRASEPLSYEVQ